MPKKVLPQGSFGGKRLPAQLLGLAVDTFGNVIRATTGK